jgi:adenosylmethionine-8-amino-7-oxononanoate aminotransferase
LGHDASCGDICDRYGVLLISDDTICSWGRLGTWFGAQRFSYLPDLITTAKGLTSGYAPMGAVIASDR